MLFEHEMVRNYLLKTKPWYFPLLVLKLMLNHLHVTGLEPMTSRVADRRTNLDAGLSAQHLDGLCIYMYVYININIY